MSRKQNIIDFWEIKHQIDDEVTRLGWSVERCKVYINQRYHKQSRLFMTDSQLIHLRDYLRSLPTPKKTSFTNTKQDRRKRRRRN